MTAFKPGDLVDISIKGVRIAGTNALTGAPTVEDEDGDEWPMPPQAAVERAVPAGWPPQVGDLWRDGEGELWFCRVDQQVPYLMASSDRYHGAAPEIVADTRSPMTLVHREEALDA